MAQDIQITGDKPIKDTATGSLKKQAAFGWQIYRQAIIDAFLKLNPRYMVRNPVMFVTEVGGVLTLILFVQALLGHGEAKASFIGGVSLWLGLDGQRMVYLDLTHIDRATLHYKLGDIRRYTRSSSASIRARSR